MEPPDGQTPEAAGATMGTADLELQGIEAGDANAAPGKNLGKVESGEDNRSEQQDLAAAGGVEAGATIRRAAVHRGPTAEARTGGDDDATRRSAGGTAPTLVAHTPSTPRG